MLVVIKEKPNIAAFVVIFTVMFFPRTFLEAKASKGIHQVLYGKITRPPLIHASAF